jgi:hypothetical protein
MHICISKFFITVLSNWGSSLIQYYVHMYVNRKMRLIEMIPGIGGGTEEGG